MISKEIMYISIFEAQRETGTRGRKKTINNVTISTNRIAFIMHMK